MPWLNIPNERSAIFIEPIRPRGGLLGGTGSTGKMSKLQALAAARKKKTEEQKLENQKTGPSLKEINPLTEKEPSGAPLKPLSIRLNGRRDDPLGHRTNGQTQPSTDAVSESGHIMPVQGSTSASSLAAEPPDNEPPAVADPSAFAGTLLGLSCERPAPVPKRQYLLPYMRYMSQTMWTSIADAFSEPSPDDVVLAAQSKGSLLARKVQK